MRRVSRAAFTLAIMKTGFLAALLLSIAAAGANPIGNPPQFGQELVCRPL